MIDINRTAENEMSYEDPLSNYEPPVYGSDLEASLAETLVAQVQSHPFASVSPQTTIRSALSLLADRQIACVIVMEEGELRGVFTERDVLNKVANQYSEVCNRPVSEVMTTNPVFVFDTDTAAAALCVLAAFGYRHVPVINRERQVQGIVSPRRILSFVEQQLRS